jgi:hypothetical protein
MTSKARFNSSFFLPIFDLAMLIALFTGAGIYWFNSHGVEQITESKREIADSKKENQDRIAGKKQEIEDSRDAKRQVILDKDALITQADLINQRILVENQKIQDGENRTRELTDQFETVRQDIERTDTQRRSKQSEILERRNEIQDRVGGLSAELADTLQLRQNFQNDIASLRRERQHDPISVFPPNAALASMVEIENQDRVYAVSLSGVVKEVGDVNLGLSGNVGLAGENQGSIKEGGVFANIPLAFRRASLDVESGLASLRDARGEDNLAAFAGATLRYAPIRKERFFLLAGTKYRDSDISLRFGIGFGRR